MNLEKRVNQAKSISIVIPCYNEQEVLPKLHASLLEVLEKLEIEFDVVLVDDGSTDLSLIHI